MANKIEIAFLSTNAEDLSSMRATLAHAYPNLNVTAYTDKKALPKERPTIFAIDTNYVSGAALGHLLDEIHETSAILLVDDFAQVRGFSHLLSGRRAILVRSDIKGTTVIHCVQHLMERQKLHEQLQKASRHLKELAIRDKLTQFVNHHHFGEILTSEVKKANRYKRPLGLVIVAIKNFTAINEAMGHREGDRILAKAAGIIQDAVREVDIPARYGDNEFAIILPESDEAAASTVASRIQDAFAAFLNPKDEKSPPIITSCGIAALSGEIETKEDIIRVALSALLEAKRNGTSAMCTSGEIAAKRHKVRENRPLITWLNNKFTSFAREAERTYFQSVMKLIGDNPVVKKTILPHLERVVFFAQRLAESCGMNEDEVCSIHRAGLLHDVGKMAIESDILAKPERLTASEMELVRQHPQFALEITGQPSFFTVEPEAILHHHERYDGSGYPFGLSADAIPRSARILSVAEAWDTMTTPQPYRPKPLEPDCALNELKSCSGKQFDGELVEKFVGLIAG